MIENFENLFSKNKINDAHPFKNITFPFQKNGVCIYTNPSLKNLQHFFLTLLIP